jgi:hypothetical protein
MNYLLVGLGDWGGKVLRAFRKRMCEELPDEATRTKQPIAFLYVNTTRDGRNLAYQNESEQDLGCSEDECVCLNDCNVLELLDCMDEYPTVRGIVTDVKAVRAALEQCEDSPEQTRVGGRMMFAAHAKQYVQALKKCVAKCQKRSMMDALEVHIFVDLGEVVASGALIDAIAQVRNMYDCRHTVITLYAMIPNLTGASTEREEVRTCSNSYASLLELNALQCGRYSPCDVLSEGVALNLYVSRIKGVANRIVLCGTTDEYGLMLDSCEVLACRVCDFVYSMLFQIDVRDEACRDVYCALNFENKDGCVLEYDETVTSGPYPDIARTKKLYSFGIERVLASAREMSGDYILHSLQAQYGNTREALHKLARNLLQQNGVLLSLDASQKMLCVRNNEPPEDKQNIDLRTVLVCVPSPGDDAALKDFAHSLTEAFRTAGDELRMPTRVSLNSPFRNELTIIAIRSIFPMRAIRGMLEYKKRYEAMVHSGNAHIDEVNTILLHGEGIAASLPDLFIQERTQEL